MAAPTFRSASASRSGLLSASDGDGMVGASAGASTVEFSSAATLGLSAVEAFITMPPLCTEIIEASPPRTEHSARTHLRIAVRAGLAHPQVMDMRAHLEATRERRTDTPAAIAGQPLTGAPQATEPMQAPGDSPAANEVSLDDQTLRVLVVSAAAAAVSRADSLRVEAPAFRTVAGTLAAGMPAVDTAAVEVTVAADTAAGAKHSA